MAREGTFVGERGAELFYRVITPAVAPRAAVIVVHGHGDHGGGLQDLCERLAGHGYITYAFDLRGHGKSSGTRGFIRAWEEYRGDLHEFRKLVTSEVPELGLYIAAHSLGGLISLDYALYHGQGIGGIVAISPAISYEVTPLERILIAVVGKFKPDYTVQKSGDPRLLTEDPVILAQLHSDDLRHNTVTPGLGRGLIQAIVRITSQAQSITLPFLLQYGADDKLTPPAKLRDFFNAIGSKDKQQHEYPAARHRPFDDACREQFYADMLGWLDRQVGTG